jgi:molybdopterin converting factor small subunit
MITVRLPSILRDPGVPAELVIDGDVPTIHDLVIALDAQVPGLALRLEDSLYNFAINDVLVIHRARDQALTDGDVVEIVPTIAGG